MRDEYAECPAPILNNSHAQAVRAAIKYAIRGATMCGQEMDFDPDAMVQNMIVGLLGYWTADGLSSDGRQTLNVYGTGTDNETSKAGLNYYRGNTRVNVDYDRFIHRLDHDPLDNMTDISDAVFQSNWRLNISDDSALHPG